MGAALLSKRRPVTAHADRLTVKLNRHATRRLWLAQTLIESGAAGARSPGWLETARVTSRLSDDTDNREVARPALRRLRPAPGRPAASGALRESRTAGATA